MQIKREDVQWAAPSKIRKSTSRDYARRDWACYGQRPLNLAGVRQGHLEVPCRGNGFSNKIRQGEQKYLMYQIIYKYIFFFGPLLSIGNCPSNLHQIYSKLQQKCTFNRYIIFSQVQRLTLKRIHYYNKDVNNILNISTEERQIIKVTNNFPILLFMELYLKKNIALMYSRCVSTMKFFKLTSLTP